MMKFIAGLLIGFASLFVFAPAALADDAPATPDYSISSTQSVFRPDATQGTKTASFVAKPGEFADQAAQGTIRNSFKSPVVVINNSTLCGTTASDGYGPASPCNRVP